LFAKTYSGIFRFIITIVIILIIVVTNTDSWFYSKPKTFTDNLFTINEVRQIFSNADKYVLAEDSVFWVEDVSGNVIGKLLCSSPFSDTIIAYSGKTPLLIGLDLTNVIKGLVLLPNDETPSYIEQLESSNFFEQWTRLTCKEAITKIPDIVSGATYSSYGISNTFRHRLQIYEKSEQKTLSYNAINLWEILLVLFVVIIALLSYFYTNKLRKYRFFLLVLSIIILGFTFSAMLSIDSIYNIIVKGASGYLQMLLLLILLLSIVLPLLFKRSFYCHYLCPYGACQELAGKLNKKKLNKSKDVKEFLGNLRPKILIAIVFMLILGIDIDLSATEPFTAFSFQWFGLSSIILFVVFLILSIFSDRVWCNYVCPTGQFIDIFRKIRNCRNFNKIKEDDKMKINEVVTLLLAIAILILVYQRNSNTVASKDEYVATTSLADKADAKDALTVIHNRKSVRNYTNQEVTKEQLEILLRAGMAAPTGRNKQPWAFVAINDKVIMDSLAIKLPYAKMLANAKAAIVVCGDMNKTMEGEGQILWVQDCSAATQNILLAAEAIGLGAVWTAAYPYKERNKAVVDALQLPTHIVPLCVIPIGYPTGEDKPKDKWKPENIYWQKWK